MRKTTLFLTLGLAFGVAACGSEAPSEDAPKPTAQAAETPEPTDPTETAKADTPEKPVAEPKTDSIPAIPLEPMQPKDQADWTGYKKHLPFIVGADAGLAEAKKQGKPALFFYAATW